MGWVMLLLFVIILLVVGLAIIGALYSLFSPFLQQLGDIKQYNMAYYGAVASVERGMVSLRHHGPGFEGKSGRDRGIQVGNTTDARSDDFGGLADGGMYWRIASQTTSIPAAGYGTVPYALRGDGSEDYIPLGYNDLLEYTLDVDPTTDESDYYAPGYAPERSSSLDSIELYARLPQQLYELYGGNSSAQLVDVCALPTDCDWDDDNVENDLVIDWSMEGEHTDGFFRIVPRVDANYVANVVNLNDTLIRESHINDTTTDTDDWTIRWASIFDPTEESATGITASHNMIAPGNVAATLGTLPYGGVNSLYSLSSVNNLKLSLGLARIVTLPDGKMYPFLETRIASDEPIADLYYHLDGVGRVGDYDVTVRVKKPTSDRSLFGSFTIVF